MRPDNENGFALVEALVALTIMALAAVSFMQIMGWSADQSRIRDTELRALSLAHTELAQVRAGDYELGLFERVDEATGMKLRVRVTEEDSRLSDGPEQPGLRFVEIDVAWSERGQDRTVSFQTYILTGRD